MRHPDRWAATLVAAALLLLVALHPPKLYAAEVTFALCRHSVALPWFHKEGDSIEVTCIPNKNPDLAIWGCVEPKLVRVGRDYTLTCKAWRQYDLTERKAG